MKPTSTQGHSKWTKQQTNTFSKQDSETIDSSFVSPTASSFAELDGASDEVVTLNKGSSLFGDSRSDGTEHSRQRASKKSKRFLNLPKSIMNRHRGSATGTTSGSNGVPYERNRPRLSLGSHSVPDHSGSTSTGTPRSTLSKDTASRNLVPFKKKPNSTIQRLNIMFRQKPKRDRSKVNDLLSRQTADEGMYSDSQATMYSDDDENVEDYYDQEESGKDVEQESEQSRAHSTSSESVSAGSRPGALREQHVKPMLTRRALRRQSIADTRGPSNRSLSEREQSGEFNILGSFDEEPLKASTEHSKAAEMQEHLKIKLAEWGIPRDGVKLLANEHLRRTSSPNGGRIESSNGDSGPGVVTSTGTDTDVDPDVSRNSVDPRENAKWIQRILTGFEQDEARTKKLDHDIELLRQSARSRIEALRESISMFENRLDHFEGSVTEKERQIKDLYQSYKSELNKEVRDKVRKQLEPREEDFYNMLDKIQKRTELIASQSSNSDVFLENILHRAISLAISGAGTIAHVLSITIVQPIAAVLGLFISFSPSDAQRG